MSLLYVQSRPRSGVTESSCNPYPTANRWRRRFSLRTISTPIFRSVPRTWRSPSCWQIWQEGIIGYIICCLSLREPSCYMRRNGSPHLVPAAIYAFLHLLNPLPVLIWRTEYELRAVSSIARSNTGSVNELRSAYIGQGRSPTKDSTTVQ